MGGGAMQAKGPGNCEQGGVDVSTTVKKLGQGTDV